MLFSLQTKNIHVKTFSCEAKKRFCSLLKATPPPQPSLLPIKESGFRQMQPHVQPVASLCLPSPTRNNFHRTHVYFIKEIRELDTAQWRGFTGNLCRMPYQEFLSKKQIRNKTPVKLKESSVRASGKQRLTLTTPNKKRDIKGEGCRS